MDFLRPSKERLRLLPGSLVGLDKLTGNRVTVNISRLGAFRYRARGAGEARGQGKKRSKNPSLTLPSSPASSAPSASPFAAHLYTEPRHRLLDNRKRLTASSGQIVNLNEETQMNNKSITPSNRSALAELSEAALSAGVLPSRLEGGLPPRACDDARACDDVSCDGDDE